MSILQQQEDSLADLVNQEPIVFMDCTQGELTGSFLLGIVVGLVLGVVIGISIGYIMFGIMAGLIIALGIAWGAMLWLRHIRQKYYLTWFKERVFLFKQLFRFSPSTFINETKRYGKGARK